METSQIRQSIADLTERADALRRYLDYDQKAERLTEVQRELEQPDVWEKPERAQALGQERAKLEQIVVGLDEITNGLRDANELLALAIDEDDAATVAEVERDLKGFGTRVEGLEFRRMFSGEMDANSAYVDIQSGAGGTEAQDWAEMLLRMYLRWAEAHDFKAEVIEASAGEVAGVKSATVHIVGDYAYGWLRTETGVHRLVRKSPFDSGNRRHTSFASVFVSPEVDDDIDIEVDPSDLRIDVYRASGAGGQHVNRTESAVRITHLPTNIVVQCQNDRSQHKNKATAMNQLKAKLYELELQKRRAEASAVEETKADVGWGSQIRSYVLDQSRIKDLRTGVETGNTQAVLDGGLDSFIEASLKQGL
ncbi:MAG: peptide chain release factor 2 [Gammaproteobacteria bacterium]|nr:peptide chain release factor 2 [Gammaproteobacteria bacterium]MDH3846900.1 peptide chain release factor 2 [Gammaproteobacteria bacterium]MDH3863860.1 peptide chain release factor 2 [Gammaproteobacteria bacterium]MDH3906547.1 peptide chain release factor 2 [Gammaproteobacteria bacterium]MDH4004963.1 peptide chain release factor 2 [Gammaproteobacteria bacterium]